MRKHRVEIDDLRRLLRPITNQLDRIAKPKIHALNDRPDFRIAQPARQTISQQCPDQRMTLDQRDTTTQLGEQKTIAPQTGCCIKDNRSNTRLNAHCLGDHLTAATAMQATMRDSPLKKIDTHRTRRLIPKLL